jgi:hypothetical protein
MIEFTNGRDQCVDLFGLRHELLLCVVSIQGRYERDLPAHSWRGILAIVRMKDALHKIARKAAKIS